MKPNVYCQYVVDPLSLYRVCQHCGRRVTESQWTQSSFVIKMLICGQLSMFDARTEEQRQAALQKFQRDMHVYRDRIRLKEVPPPTNEFIGRDGGIYDHLYKED